MTAAKLPSARPRVTKTERLASAISGIIGLRVDPGQIYGARGFYRHRQADVQPWTGVVKDANGTPRSLGSWETMTDALRYGFVVYEGDRNDYSDFVICSLGPKSGEKPTNGMGCWLPPRMRAREAALLADANASYSTVQLEEIAAAKTRSEGQ